MNPQKNANATKIIVLLLFVGIVGVIVYWRTGVEEVPGDYHVRKGNYRLEDGQYEQAVEEFNLALREKPDHVDAHLGLAIAYMQLGNDPEALREFDRVLAIDPAHAVAYADRGILYDRTGRYEEALASYKKAIELDPTVLEGPGWLWRFMRNIDEKPPTIKDRADYLEAELKKPPEKRLLHLPAEDEKQRMYKVD